MSHNKTINALHYVSETLIAIDRCSCVDTAARSVNNCKNILIDRFFAIIHNDFNKRHFLTIKVFKVELAHYVTHRVVVCVLCRASLVIAGDCTQNPVPYRREHIRHFAFLLSRSHCIIEGSRHRVACTVVDKVAAEREIYVFVFGDVFYKLVPRFFVVSHRPKMHVRNRIYNNVAVKFMHD